jgi:hypothetical protein
MTHFAGDAAFDMALRNFMFWCLVIMTVVCSGICFWNWLGWKRDKANERKGKENKS